MPTENKSTPKVDLVEIEVDSDTHIHQGKPCLRGAKIQVSPAVAAMLKDEWEKKKK